MRLCFGGGVETLKGEWDLMISKLACYCSMKLPSLPLTYCSSKYVGNFDIVGSDIVPKNVIVTS